MVVQNKKNIRSRTTTTTTTSLPSLSDARSLEKENDNGTVMTKKPYSPSPCTIDDISNDVVNSDGSTACNELPKYYGPCGIPSADSILLTSQYYNVTIGFDYELYYSGSRSGSGAAAAPVDHIQGIILEHLASIWGVGCDNNDGGRDRSLQESLALVALSSSPQDRLNDAVPCRAPASSVPGATACTSVEGSLTIFTGPNSDENFLRLSNGVVREVRSAMDQHLYTTTSTTTGNNIEQVNFVGQRGFFLPPPPTESMANAPPATQDDTTKSSSSTIIVASLVSVLLLLVVATVFFVLFVVLKRGHNNNNNMKYSEDISTSDEEGMLTDEEENNQVSSRTLEDGPSDDDADEDGRHHHHKPQRSDDENEIIFSRSSSSSSPTMLITDRPRCVPPQACQTTTTTTTTAPEPPQEEFLKDTLALARSLSTEPVDFSYHTYEGDGSEDALSIQSSAASSSQGGLHLVDDSEDEDTVFESLRRVTEIDFS